MTDPAGSELAPLVGRARAGRSLEVLPEPLRMAEAYAVDAGDVHGSRRAWQASAQRQQRGGHIRPIGALSP